MPNIFVETKNNYYFLPKITDWNRFVNGFHRERILGIISIWWICPLENPPFLSCNYTWSLSSWPTVGLAITIFGILDAWVSSCRLTPLLDFGYRSFKKWATPTIRWHNNNVIAFQKKIETLKNIVGSTRYWEKKCKLWWDILRIMPLASLILISERENKFMLENINYLLIYWYIRNLLQCIPNSTMIKIFINNILLVCIYILMYMYHHANDAKNSPWKSLTKRFNELWSDVLPTKVLIRLQKPQ